jgi:hypothetical protein
MTLSVKLFAVGTVLEIVFVLMLFLPGQNIHGGRLTGLTLFVGLVPPPLCFVTGLGVALYRAESRRVLGIVLNVVALVVYGLWISGVVGKVFE